MASGILSFFVGVLCISCLVIWLIPVKKTASGVVLAVTFFLLAGLTVVSVVRFPIAGGESNLTPVGGYNADKQIMLLDSHRQIYLVPATVRPWRTRKVEPGYYSRWFHWYRVEEPTPMQILGGRQNEDGTVLLAITERDLTIAKRPLVITVEEGNQFQFPGTGASYVLALPDKFLWVPAPAETGSRLSIRERIDKGTAVPIIQRE